MVFYDWNYLTRDFGLLKYLREKHKRLKLVYLFSNIVAISGSRLYKIVDKLNENYDAVFAFDRLDSEKYGFLHTPLIYTTDIQLPAYSDQLEYDLYYLGQAKDRYDKLIEIYESATNQGLKCLFTIVGVDPKNRKYADSIRYEKISYAQAIEEMGKSKCLVDVIQGNSTALTIKTCEAVVLGRKLLTSNTNVSSESFFHPENICICDTMPLKNFMEMKYTPYTDSEISYFSPYVFFEKIEQQLGL